MKMTIQTSYGKKSIIRRIGVAGEYYQEVPGPNAQHGGWWVLNPQRGFVPIPSNGRALMLAKKEAGL